MHVKGQLVRYVGRVSGMHGATGVVERVGVGRLRVRFWGLGYECVRTVHSENTKRVDEVDSRLHPAPPKPGPFGPGPSRLVGHTVAVYSGELEYEGEIVEAFYADDPYTPGIPSEEAVYKVRLENGAIRLCQPGSVGTKMVVTS